MIPRPLIARIQLRDLVRIFMNETSRRLIQKDQPGIAHHGNADGQKPLRTLRQGSNGFTRPIFQTDQMEDLLRLGPGAPCCPRTIGDHAGGRSRNLPVPADDSR